MKNDLPAIAKPNWIDRTFAYVAPGLAIKRLQARGMFTLLGGYAGARSDRPGLGLWRPKSLAPDDEILQGMDDLRGRARELARNAPPATSAIGVNVTHVVGTGLALRPMIDAARLKMSEEEVTVWQKTTLEEWRLWALNADCDVTRRCNFYGLQRLALRAMLESGDVFAATPEVQRLGRPYRLAVQLIEADRVCNPNLQPDSDTQVAGVELDGNGAPLAYHVAKVHPGAVRRKGQGWTRIDAYGAQTGRRNMLHLYEPLRPGQTRGVPYLAPVIEPLKQLARYTEAELQAAVVAGAFSVFFKMDPQVFEMVFDRATPDQQGQFYDMQMDRLRHNESELSYGKAINLQPGEEALSVNPGRPNAAFDPFVQAVLVQIGMALELPYEILVLRFQSSYSAARAALLAAWRVFRMRREWLADGFCQPLYELWLQEAIARGRVSAPGFFADPRLRAAWSGAQWIGDGPGSIDPDREVSAAEKRVDLGISTRAAESLLHDGIDWEEKHEQLVREKSRRDADGLGAPKPPAGPAAQAAQAKNLPSGAESPTNQPPPEQPE